MVLFSFHAFYFILITSVSFLERFAGGLSLQQNSQHLFCSDDTHTLQNWKCMILDQQNRSGGDNQDQPRVPRQVCRDGEHPRSSWEVISKPGSGSGLETASRVGHSSATSGQVYSDEAGLRSSQKVKCAVCCIYPRFTKRFVHLRFTQITVISSYTNQVGNPNK